MGEMLKNKNRILSLIKEFSLVRKKAKKVRYFEQIFFELGEKTAEKSVQKLKDLGVDVLFEQSFNEIKDMIIKKLSGGRIAYMHKFSKDIFLSFAYAKNDRDRQYAAVKAARILSPITNVNIKNRIITEVATELKMDVLKFVELIGKCSADKPTHKQKIERFTGKVYDLLDYFDLEYKKKTTVDVGKYKLVVNAYIMDHDAIVDVIDTKDASKERLSQILWRQNELRKRFKTCIFLTPDEAIRDRINGLDKINSALNLGYRAMDLVAFD